MTRVPAATVNGLGRFGLGVLSAWAEDSDRTYGIEHIHDDVLTIHQIAAIMQSDPIVSTFHDADVRCWDDVLSFSDPLGRRLAIQITTGDLASIPRPGRTRLLFDCSGRASDFIRYKSTLRDIADLILIGATTDVADATLVMGHNEADFDGARHRVVSFGSCTVIPGVHVISRLHAAFGLEAALVNIVHSVSRWRLETGEVTGLSRKICSLEAAATALIPTLPPRATKVNYTYAPYTGVSLMDFGCTLVRPATADQVLQALSEEKGGVPARNIIGFVSSDEGGQAHLHAQTSMNVVSSSIDVRDDRVHFFGYFNNDGSGNRLHELAKYLLARTDGS